MKNTILITLLFMLSPSGFAKKSENGIRGSYMKICLKLPNLANKGGRFSFCDCMADGHMKKGLNESDLAILTDLYSERKDNAGGSDRAKLLFNMDIELAEICTKHLKSKK